MHFIQAGYCVSLRYETLHNVTREIGVTSQPHTTIVIEFTRTHVNCYLYTILHVYTVQRDTL